MTLDANRSLSSLTVADLEHLVRQIVLELMQRGLRPPAQVAKMPDALLKTFGTWEDERSTETIIEDVYKHRSSSEDGAIL